MYISCQPAFKSWLEEHCQSVILLKTLKRHDFLSVLVIQNFIQFDLKTNSVHVQMVSHAKACIGINLPCQLDGRQHALRAADCGTLIPYKYSTDIRSFGSRT